MNGLPWFRLYTEFASDPDVQSLAFEDQRHYVMALCLKGSGVLDKAYPSPERRELVIAQALGLDRAAAAEARRRLSDAGLVDPEWQPKGWDRRQFQSDSSTDRTRRWRAQRSGDATGTSQERHQTQIQIQTSDSENRRTGLVPLPEPIALLPVQGGGSYGLTTIERAQMEAFYPDVNVDVELRKMQAWFHANPDRIKSRRGIKRSIGNWMATAQADAERARRASPSRKTDDEKYRESQL